MRTHSEFGGSEDEVQVGDHAKVFYEGVECEGVVTAKATHGFIGVSVEQSGRLKLPAGSMIGVSTADIIGIGRAGREVL